MHFDSGRFGAVVVVIALVLTIVIGYCTDVTKVQVERTGYDYVTDITGLFDTEEVPEYITFNPNTNYVGYTGDITYSPSNQPNNYRYIVEEGEVTTDSDSLYYNEIRDYPPEISKFTSIYINYTGSLYSFTPQFSYNNFTYNAYALANYPSHNTSITTLYQILNNADFDISTAKTIEIDFSFSNVDYPVFAFPSINSFEINKGTIDVWTVTATDNNILDRVVVDASTLYCKGYRGNSLVWEGSATNIPVVYGYFANEYSDIANFDKVPVTLNIDATITGQPIYGYADPSQGVSIPTFQVADWDNGYEVKELTLLVTKNSTTYTHGIQFYFNLTEETSVELGVLWQNNSMSISGTYFDSVLEVGKWEGLEIVFDFITQELKITPTGTISDFMEEPSIKGQTYTYVPETVIEPTVSTFQATSVGQPARFGVLNTTVFLNTYGVVMKDPSINIQDYWSDLNEYRLNFYSFALVGDSVTINGVTYPVSGTQTITIIDVDGEEYTKTLSNIYITVEKVEDSFGNSTDHTFLTFVNDSLTVDLGETTTEIVSYDGLWYFTSALYEGKTVTVSEYDWNLDGSFSATAGQTIVIFIGLVCGGLILGRVVLKQEFAMLDYIIMIGAIVIAFAVSGVFI